MGVSLVIMAAGMGSRFGGLKQMEGVGQNGEIIADYSVFDAKAAGFSKIIFVIKREMEEVFKERVFDKISRHIDAAYVFQDIDDLPSGLSAPVGRTKPWGTAHAVWAARNAVDGSFMVINADDFYGAAAFRDVYGFLTTNDGETATKIPFPFCMAGYLLKNTVSESGSVSRGVCRTDNKGNLLDIEEVPAIKKTASNFFYLRTISEYLMIDGDTLVSMNAWGFTRGIFPAIEEQIRTFFENGYNLQSGEVYLPSVVKLMLDNGRATVKVLPCRDTWYGFTYKEDKENVVAAVADMTERGLYPARLWQVK